MNIFIGITLLLIVFFLIRNVLKNKTDGRGDLLVENVRTFGAAVLIFILAIGFLTTNKPFCELVPFICR